MAVSFSRSASQILAELAKASPSRRHSAASSNDSADADVQPAVVAAHKPSLVLGEDAKESAQNFTVRLDSFFARVTLWPLPDTVCPLKCARHGWYCVEKNLLQCVSCFKYISGHLPSPSQSLVYLRCVQDLSDSLISAHEIGCKWRCNPTPEYDTSPDVLDEANILSELRCRYNSLLNLEWKTTRVATAELLQLRENELHSVRSMMDVEGDSNDAALKAAVCGWTAAADNAVQSIFCRYCRRNVALFAFAIDTSDLSVSPTSKRRKLDSFSQPLNFVQQHRPWCPWVQPPSIPSALHCSVSGNVEGKQRPSVVRWRAALSVLHHRAVSRHRVAFDSHAISSEFALARQLLEEVSPLTDMTPASADQDTSADSGTPSALLSF